MPTLTSKILRQLFLVTAYSTGLAFSLWFAYLLRFDFQVDPAYFVHFGWQLLAFISVKLLLLYLSGQFGSLLSYFGFHDLGKICGVCGVAALAALGVWYFFSVPIAAPRAVIVTDLLVSLLFLTGFRLSLRLVREGYFDRPNEKSSHRRVAVIGAGDVGATLVRDFQVRRGLGLRPIAFFDDNRAKWGTSIHGITVHGAPDSLPDFVKLHQVDEVIIAMPSASGRRIKELVTLLQKLRLRFEMVPSYEQLRTGKVRVSQIRPVEIQDLLGRPTINMPTDRIEALVKDQVVMVTGAGGSIGSELCRQILSFGPRQILLVERSEYLLFQIEQELLRTGLRHGIHPLVADILDRPRMELIFRHFQPSLVFHAAAHKHVPMMEHQPSEAFRNNVLGTRQLADLAGANRVKRFVLISTDKAINPTNVMGATKRIAELYLQARQGNDAGSTAFMAVRFGNVLGSSGSVIPTFKRQIASGGPVTVTHPEITRYFMTVNEAVGLVLQAATLGTGGEIFVLDMGQPMKIIDVARQLIELSGLEPEIDIEIQITGLRPGEKLYEELNHDTENHAPTDHPQIMRFVCPAKSLSDIETEICGLEQSLTSVQNDELKRTLNRIVPEYRPYFGGA